MLVAKHGTKLVSDALIVENLLTVSLSQIDAMETKYQFIAKDAMVRSLGLQDMDLVRVQGL